MIPAEPTARDATPRAKWKCRKRDGKFVSHGEWSAHSESANCTASVAIHEGRKVVAMVVISEPSYGSLVTAQGGELGARADRLVRAWNLHDDLVAALSGLVATCSHEHVSLNTLAAITDARALLARERAAKGTTP